MRRDSSGGAGDVTGGWLATRSGGRVYPLTGGGTYTTGDVAYGLAGTGRWAAQAAHGRHNERLVIAQHANTVASLARACGEGPWVQMACLHHDDAEAFLGDMPSPIKGHVRFEVGGELLSYGDVESWLLEDILVRWGLPRDLVQRHQEAVKVYDVAVLVREADVLMHGTADWSRPPDVARDVGEAAVRVFSGQDIWPPVIADYRYCELHAQLAKEIGL